VGISKKSWTGIAVETTPGTAVLVPTKFHPCTSKVSNQKKFIYLSEQRGSRDANTKRKASVRAASGEITGTFYLDTSPYLLLGFMGFDTVSQPDATNAPTAYTHALTLVDTPPKMTFTKGYDVAGYYAAFSAVEKISYTWAADNKLLEETVSFQSRYMQRMSSAQFTAAGTPTYSTDALPGNGSILAGYMPTLKFDGIASSTVEDMTVEMSQTLTLFYAINGSKDFVKIFYGDRDAKINFTASFDDPTVNWDKYDQEVDQHISVEFLGAPFNNIQTISIPSATTAGNFTLSYKGQTTGNISWNAANTAVATALTGLSTIGAAGVTVTGGPGPSAPWIVTFAAPLSHDPTLIQVASASLTPSAQPTIVQSGVQERFFMDFPIVGWDTMDIATDKEYIQLTAQGVARPGGTLNSTMTASVTNAVASYAT